MAILSFDFATSILLSFIGLVWVKRVLWMMRFRKTHPPLLPSSETNDPSPKVSVIVPARNEEKNIRHCLLHLLAQNYAHYEMIVVDDRSTDKTSELVNALQIHSKIPIKLVRVEKLPTGWTGKNYAMFAGSKAAGGEWLLFTDADTTHQQESLSTALHEALEKKIDFLTLTPEVESNSFWENVVQPLAASSLALWFDPNKVNDTKSKITLANGQFILIRKDAYEKVGGNESVKNEVVEDVELAKKVRAAGYFVQFLNGTRLYSTRMYSSLKEIRTGWTRIFLYLFDKKPLPILHKIFLFFLFSCVPFFVLLFELTLKIAGHEAGRPLAGRPAFSEFLFGFAGLVCLWMILVRFVGNKFLKSNPWYAIFHLLGSLVMIWILFSCLERIIFKRPSVWRGDLYR